ncbi:MAG: helix-turn-helix transcriptional regulator [Cyanobacteria bacterium CRU_2_1]|nr:helix-turn-helix transcriptional regulator [Cyanobacteria bacterium RU_5_0]NJR59993.1 helix-turn-helix transcriptional regulator [Cyanobacteria bacterium CRU_2_1]
MTEHFQPGETIAPSPTNCTPTEQRAKIFAALSDPTRLRIVELLAEKSEMSGSEIAAQSGISLALFCHHSKMLAEAGIIQVRREGQTKYNSLNRELLLSCFTSFQGLCAAKAMSGCNPPLIAD